MSEIFTEIVFPQKGIELVLVYTLALINSECSKEKKCILIPLYYTITI